MIIKSVIKELGELNFLINILQIFEKMSHKIRIRLISFHLKNLRFGA